MIFALVALMLQTAGAPSAPPPPPPPATETGMSPARAKANLASLFSDEDYPPEAVRNGEQGTVEFRLTVGQDGIVAGCTVTSSSGSASLDSTTCRLLTERARFSPARDSQGLPVSDSVVGRITWRAGEKSFPTLEASLLVVTTLATPAGETSCSLAHNGKPQDVLSCPDPDPGMVEAARASGRVAEETVVLITTPRGETEPVDGGGHGTQTFESEASLSIAPDGSVLECRVVRSEARGPAPDGPAPNPCGTYPRGSQQFEPLTAAGAAAGPRAVSVKVRRYFRLISGRRLPTT